MNAAVQTMLEHVDAIKRDGAALVVGLTEAQFNWHPAPQSWSIAQCLDHLNFGVLKTLPAFDQSIADGRARRKTSTGPFRYSWFSRLVVASMEPPPKFRMKTPLKKPAEGTFRLADVVPEFSRVRDELAARIQSADGLDLVRVRITSPVNRLLRMPLGAYFEFILAHDRRHLWQARKVRTALA